MRWRVTELSRSDPSYPDQKARVLTPRAFWSPFLGGCVNGVEASLPGLEGAHVT